MNLLSNYAVVVIIGAILVFIMCMVQGHKERKEFKAMNKDES